MRGEKFIIGLDPDPARLEEEGFTILEGFHGPVTAVLLKVPASRALDARRLFRGIAHVYETEGEARRVWRLFGQ